MESSYVAAAGLKRKTAAIGADDRERSSSPAAAFPAVGMCYDDDDDAGAEERREMDFFKKEKRERISEAAADHDAVDSAPDDLRIMEDDLTINVGLHVGRRKKSGSEDSSVDDDASPNEGGHRRGATKAELALTKDELTLTKVELERLKEENQQLRTMLNNANAKYHSLHAHLVAMMQQRNHRGGLLAPVVHELNVDPEKKEQLDGGVLVPRQFISLVGGTSSAPGVDSAATSPTSNHLGLGSPTVTTTQSSLMDYSTCGMMSLPTFDHHHCRPLHEGVSGSSAEEPPPPPPPQGWLPNKVPKFLPAKGPEQATEAAAATMRKARVSVRALSEAPMISDGCQWRKYGQKMAKGNPCPRAYYRCTMAAGCPVRKQVQRCAEDRTVLITTYEGRHNHPLPPAAMAMASTTAAASSMLLSGSMPSADGSLMAGSNFLARAVLPGLSGVATISASAPFPTVTLDFTQPSTPPPAAAQAQPATLQSALAEAARAPAPQLPQLFGQTLYDHSKLAAVQNAAGTKVTDAGALADTVSAAAAITSDPNFTAVLAAAITSYIGSGAGAGAGGGSGRSSGADNGCSRDDKTVDNSG